MRRPVLHRFSSLLSAHVWREILQAVFLLSLARQNPTAYGEVMLAFQFGAILLFLSEGGMNPFLVEHLTHDPSHRRTWLRRFSLARLVVLLLVCFGAWLFTRLQGYSSHLQLLVLVLGGAIGLDALAGTFFVGLQVAGKQATEGRIRGVAATLGWGYSLAALAMGWGVFRLSIGKWIETLVGILGGARTTALKKEAAVPPVETQRRAPLVWRDYLPFAWLAIAAILYNKANIFFLQRWGGSDAVAQYSATWQLVDGLPILVSNLLLGRVLYPLFVLQWRTGRPTLSHLVQETVRWLSLVSLLAVFTLSLGSGPLIHLLYGSAYMDAARLQPILVWSIPFALLHNTAAYLLLAAGRRWFLVIAYGAALLLNLLLCRYGIPAAPLTGAAWAIVITKGCLAVVTVTAACQLFPFWRWITLGELLLVAVLGGGAYWATTPILGIWALVPAWIPSILLAWRWWREHVRRTPPGSECPASESFA